MSNSCLCFVAFSIVHCLFRIRPYILTRKAEVFTASSTRDFCIHEQVGDRDRGYLLELLLTKLRYAAGGGECDTAENNLKENRNSNSSWSTDLQIVGMSATMPNVSDVATWLQVPIHGMLFLEHML